MKIFRIIPEFRILRLIFHRKSASKCWIRQMIIASLIIFSLSKLEILIFCWCAESFKIWISKVQDFRIFELSPMLPVIFVLKMSAFDICCVLHLCTSDYNNHGSKHNKVAVWSGLILNEIKETKVHKQMREHTAIIVNGGKRVNWIIHRWKFSGLFPNSGFWGWISIESQPQNAELGRL